MSPGATFTPNDTLDWGLPLAGPGLLLDVPAEGRWRQRPALHLEAAPRYRLRLVSGGQPLLWVRIDPYWDRACFFRGASHAPWGLPAVRAQEVRAVPHAPGSAPWWDAWAWHLGRALVDAPATVLYLGRWCLRPVRAIAADQAVGHPVSPMEWGFGQANAPPHSLDGVLSFLPFWREDWWEEVPAQRRGGVLPLRPPSEAADGRVKSWRKHARDGTLPPALLLYVDILERWLVLDGHDRIHAALLEGVEPPLLGLWPFIEHHSHGKTKQEGALLGAEIQLRAGATPEVIDRVNRQLLRSFTAPPRGTVTRAWPVAGGVEAWRAEVLAWRRGNGVTVNNEDWSWFASVKT